MEDPNCPQVGSPGLVAAGLPSPPLQAAPHRAGKQAAPIRVKSEHSRAVPLQTPGCEPVPERRALPGSEFYGGLLAECLGIMSLMPTKGPPTRLAALHSAVLSKHQSPSTCWLMECTVLLHVPSLLFFLNVTVILQLCFLFRIRCVGWYIIYEFYFLDSKDVS